MHVRKKVLVLWADNQAANLGLRVLANGNAEIVRRALLGDADVDFQDFGPGDSDVSFGTKAIIRDMFSKAGPIKAKLRQYDLVIDSGAGDSFTDIYGLKRLSFIFYTHGMLRRLQIPLIMGPQTIGPFSNRVARALARKSLRQARLVMTRDSYSYNVAVQYGASYISKTTDVVFTLPRIEHVRRWDVIFNVSGLLWFSDKHVPSSVYRDACVRFIESLRENGYNVALLAHVVHSPSGNDDIDAARELLKCIDEDTHFDLLIPEDLSAARVYVASAGLVVGARMHACLNALSLGIPAIPWAYSRKFEPLLQDIGWHHCVDLRKSADVAEETLNLMRSLQPSEMDLHIEQMHERLLPQVDSAVLSLREAL